MQRGDRETHGPPIGDINVYDEHVSFVVPETGFIRQWSEIPRQYLKISDELGSGAFGVVKKGYLMRNNKVVECAVKMLKSKFEKLHSEHVKNCLFSVASFSFLFSRHAAIVKYVKRRWRL